MVSVLKIGPAIKNTLVGCFGRVVNDDLVTFSENKGSKFRLPSGWPSGGLPGSILESF